MNEIHPVTDRTVLSTIHNHIEVRAIFSPTADDFCRVCQDNEAPEPLVSVCLCSGSTRWIHMSCLVKWVRSASCSPQNRTHCEICRGRYHVGVVHPPCCSWNRPTLNRRQWCLVYFAMVVIVLVACTIGLETVFITRLISEQRWAVDGVLVTIFGIILMFYVWLLVKKMKSLVLVWRSQNAVPAVLPAAPPTDQEVSNALSLCLPVPEVLIDSAPPDVPPPPEHVEAIPTMIPSIPDAPVSNSSN
eukprot:gnl/Spiro4/9686_TR5146_c0_g1_i1.p1 gnl/Spiro4/9686_TR5146_c0_g1~~gnl/Spiro4/9686_TR5146_c0_g1_i1.p1  ORF type:complete len:245 (+),score=13.04 gnl/Spiro4/9686_TR5146_c0_g1_i1:83-817(+)